MSTTTQEPLVAPETEAAEPEKEKASEREYVVLEQRAKDGPWVEIKRVDAGSVKEALESLGTDMNQAARYVAVAERYWRPATPTVETTTTVTLSFD